MAAVAAACMGIVVSLSQPALDISVKEIIEFNNHLVLTATPIEIGVDDQVLLHVVTATSSGVETFHDYGFYPPLRDGGPPQTFHIPAYLGLDKIAISLVPVRATKTPNNNQATICVKVEGET